MKQYKDMYDEMKNNLINTIKANKDLISCNIRNSFNGKTIGYVKEGFESDIEWYNGTILQEQIYPIFICGINDDCMIYGSPANKDNVYYDNECEYPLEDMTIETLIKIVDIFCC